MGYKDGWAAINLEMPDIVPRVEYSAEGHYSLVEKVTGIPVNVNSTEEEKSRAALAFRKAWDYSFNWNILIGGLDMWKCRTTMGHAVYAEGGTDFDTNINCPFKDPEEVLAFQPMDVYGRFEHSKLVQDFNEHYKKACLRTPDEVNMTGVYVTLVSGLLEAFGWDMLLLALGMDPEGFGEVANRYTEWIQQYFNAMADSIAPVIMVHDDMVWTSGPFANPAWYRKYIFPNLKKLLAPLREAGKKIMVTSDGNFTEFIDDFVDCGANGFCMEPTTDMALFAEKYGKTHSFIGNADTRILLYGSKEDIYNEVKRCMDIGKKCPGFFMSVGNHIPPNTPVESALYYNECYEKMKRR